MARRRGHRRRLRRPRRRRSRSPGAGARVTVLEARPAARRPRLVLPRRRDRHRGGQRPARPDGLLPRARSPSSSASARPARSAGRRTCASTWSHPRLGAGAIACPRVAEPAPPGGRPAPLPAAVARASALRALRAGLALMRDAPPPRSARSRRATVDELLARLGQSAHARASFWNPVALATLNETPERAAAAPFVEVLARAFFRSRADSQFVLPRGRPRRPLHRRRAPLRRAARRTRLDPRAGGRARARGRRACAACAARRPAPRRRRAASPRCRRAALAPLLPPALARRARRSRARAARDVADRERAPVVRPAGAAAATFVGLLGTTTQWAFNRSRLLGETAATGPVRQRRDQRRRATSSAGTRDAVDAHRAWPTCARCSRRPRRRAWSTPSS